MKLLYRAITIVVLFGLLWGCATLPPPQVAVIEPDAGLAWPSEALRETFYRYWGLRAAGQYENSFALEAPYLQEIAPLWAYLMKVDTRENRIERLELLRIIEENPMYYTIGLNLIIVQPNGMERRVYLADRWVQVADQWYHVMIDPVMKQFFP